MKRIIILPLALIAACQNKPEAAKAPTAAAKTAGHGHMPGVHSGAMIVIGPDAYHAEAVFTEDGGVRLYLYGQDETKVHAVEMQTPAAYAKAFGTASIPVSVTPTPQPGDAFGTTSAFTLSVPAELRGKWVEITLPQLRFGVDRYRVSFTTPRHDDGHGLAHGATGVTPAMPAKLGNEEERELFLKPGGAYTTADIQANGNTIPTIKFKGIKAQHDDHPKPGDILCPISKTKANSKFPWVINGQTYYFCCDPCIEEFVNLAKTKPKELKPPSEFIKQ